MTPQELKNSILQLAIQGKLVEQRPEEGTAEELYRQIQAEKQALIKAGKIKKEKPLPEITEDEKPFDIPESWKWARFGNIISLLSGTDFKPEEYNDQAKGIPYITGASSLSENGVLVSRWTESPRVLVEAGDVLLVCKGSGYGKTVICDIKNAHIARQIMAIKRLDSVDMHYFMTFLKANIQQIKANGQGVIPGIDRGSILSMFIPLPPLAEQKRIVAKIEELLPLIDRYEKAWSRLEDFNKRFPGDMQKSILQMAIQGKLVEQRPEEGTGEELYKQIQAEKQALIKAGKIKKEKPLPEIAEDEIPFEIPKSWKWVRLNTIYQFIDYRGKTPKKIQSGIRLIGSGNIRKRYLDFSNENSYISEEEYSLRKSRGLTKQGDILFVTEGGSTGNAAINTWNGECSCGQRVITLQSYNPPLLENMLFLNFILSEYFQHAIRDRRTGSAATGIKGDTLKQVLIPLPPLAEQKRIVARLEELLPLCEKLK